MKVVLWTAALAAMASCQALPKLSTQFGSGSASVSGSTPASAGASGTEKVQDDVRSGLETTSMLDANPAGFRVTWINWDSAFRATDLRIGDRIIAVDGEQVVKPPKLEDVQRMLPKSIGQYAEQQRWAERGARDGTEIALTVQRRAKSGVGVDTLTIRGKLRADRIYSNGMRRLIGPAGPDSLANDGFDGPWSGWYEKQQREWEKVLDEGWTHQRFNSAMQLAAHLDEKKRVDFLVTRYPGPFADSVKADWERVRASLVGKRYTIKPAAMQYRRLGDERAAEISAVAQTARDAFVASVKADTIAPFPAIDPIRGDRKKVTGKVVVLPEASTRDWVMEADHGWMVIADRSGAYFVDMQKPEARRMLEARYRYTKFVKPNLKETYAIIGRIEPDPKMLVRSGRAVTGLEVKPIAVTMGGGMFVDLTSVKAGESKFAGEEALAAPKLALPPPTATPREVMEAFVTALKYGDETTWKSLYATWWAEDWKEEGVLYHPYDAPRLDEDWIRARRLVLDKVHDVVVIYVSDPRRIMTGREFPKAPVIDQVLVEVDHVGKVDAEYHAFTDVNVHRVWLLQRRDGGPWRIASRQGL